MCTQWSGNIVNKLFLLYIQMHGFCFIVSVAMKQDTVQFLQYIMKQKDLSASWYLFRLSMSDYIGSLWWVLQVSEQSCSLTVFCLQSDVESLYLVTVYRAFTLSIQTYHWPRKKQFISCTIYCSSCSGAFGHITWSLKPRRNLLILKIHD